MTMARHLAITMGDPAGIGPEIIVKAAAKLRDRLAAGDLRLLVIGSGAALRSAQAQLGLGQPIPEVGDGRVGSPRRSCRPDRRASRSGRGALRRWRALRLPGGRARRAPRAGRPDRRRSSPRR